MSMTTDTTRGTTREGEEKTKPSVGFIGMGHMGSAIARRLLDAGYSLAVYDRTPERPELLGQRGASIAQTPAALADLSEVVMICVADNAA
jgi:3-hydroxyisobutyrate dehydrogenase